MPGMISTIAKTAIVLVCCLVVADVIGVIACTLFDIAPIRSDSAVLPYAIWLVLGIFCGLFAHNGAGVAVLRSGNDASEWTNHVDAYRAGNIIVGTSAAVLLALTLLFRHMYWSQGVVGKYYVPDSAPHTYVFFLSALGAIIAAHALLVPRNEPGGPR